MSSPLSVGSRTQQIDLIRGISIPVRGDEKFLLLAIYLILSAALGGLIGPWYDAPTNRNQAKAGASAGRNRNVRDPRSTLYDRTVIHNTAIKKVHHERRCGQPDTPPEPA